MMATTHTAFSLTLTSLALGTANPIALLIAALACQLSDVDTSKSTVGRILFPLSRFIEKRLPHRSVTHSFLATGIFTLATYRPDSLVISSFEGKTEASEIIPLNMLIGQ